MHRFSSTVMPESADSSSCTHCFSNSSLMSFKTASSSVLVDLGMPSLAVSAEINA